MRCLAMILSASLMGTVFADTLHYEGSSTVGKFISDAATAYNAAEFTLNTVPESSGGEQCAMRQTCDLGGVAREVEEKFSQRNVVSTLIGKDAIAVLVNAENPIKALSTAQLQGIFSGQIKNWQEVGGEDLAIRVLVVKETSATRKVFQAAILGDVEYGAVEVVNPDAKVLSLVARDKSAIGQLSFAFLGGHDEVHAISVDNQAANVHNSAYPITRPLYLTTYGEPQGAVKAFIDWTLSDAGQAVVKQRFVGIR